MRTKLAIAAATIAALGAAVLPASPAAAAWNDVMSQGTMLSQWCAAHNYPGSSGNWYDGLYCWRPVQGSVLQTQSPGYMCRWLLGDSTVSFHIILPIESKNGACGYWIG